MEKYPTEEKLSAPLFNNNNKILQVKGVRIDGVWQIPENDDDSYAHLTSTDLQHGLIERHKCDDFPEAKKPLSIISLLKTKGKKYNIALVGSDGVRQTTFEDPIKMPYNTPQVNINMLAGLGAKSQMSRLFGIETDDIEKIYPEPFVNRADESITIYNTLDTGLSKEEIIKLTSYENEDGNVSSDFIFIPSENHEKHEISPLHFIKKIGKAVLDKVI